MKKARLDSSLILEFDHVFFGYGEHAPKILSDVSWKIPKNTWCSLLGPNGVGKSTVLHLIAGEIHPTQGKVLRYFENDRMAYVPQYTPFLDASVLVADVVATVRRCVPQLQWIEPKRWESIFGLKEIWHRNIATLSTGQRQRLVIGLYLLKPADIIVLDEPTNGCDVNNANMIYELLESIRKELGITIIHVSHEIHQVLAFAKEVICMGLDSHVHRHVGDLTHGELEHAYGCELQKLVHVHKQPGGNA